MPHVLIIHEVEAYPTSFFNTTTTPTLSSTSQSGHPWRMPVASSSPRSWWKSGERPASKRQVLSTCMK